MRRLEVNDKVYVLSGGHHQFINAGVVSKVTPSGMVDVMVNGQPSGRYDKEGYERGERGMWQKRLDTMDFDDRTALIEQEKRASIAAESVRKICADQSVRFRWGKEGLSGELERLQKLIDEARVLVEGI